MAAVHTVVFGISACILSLLDVAAAQAQISSRDKGLAAGELVSVGSHRLYCECRGRGDPVIVLQTGITETFRTWEATLAELAETTRVCVYDRAGYGESDAGPLPRAGEQACQELRLLLDDVLPSTQVVFLGHSLGAMYAILFAAKFPDRVAGMVLVDPPPLAFLRGQRFANLRVMAEEATGEWERTAVASSQAGQEEQALFFRTIASEHEGMFSEDADAIAAIETLGDLPLVAVAAGRPNPAFGDSAAAFQEFWIESSRNVASLSSRGKLIVAERSGHHVHQEDARLLVDTILELVTTLRDTTRVDEE